MITKGSIVEKALSKLLGDAFFPGSAEGQGNIEKGLDDLEAMMAHWQADGFELCYNFAPDDVTPLAKQDSFLLLWMKLPVATNLAILLAPDFGIIPDQSLVSEAGSGMRTIIRRFSHNGSVKRPAGILPVGEGSIRTGIYVSNPDYGYGK